MDAARAGCRSKRHVRPANGGASCDSESAPDQTLLPALVLLAWSQPGHALSAAPRGYARPRGEQSRLLQSAPVVGGSSLHVSLVLTLRGCHVQAENLWRSSCFL